MCMSCGCRNYEDAHNDERNITVASLQRASDASNVPVQDIVRNLAEACESVSRTGIPDHQSRGEAVIERLRPD